MVKFIHTGDIHLGLKFQNVSFSKEIAKDRRIELWTTFQRIINYGKEKQVDFILIAGDLFEANYFTLADMKRVRDILSEAKDIHIIISAGNHDYIDSASLYKKVDWGDSVTIFTSPSIDKKEFKDKNTTVYGLSWASSEIKARDLLDNIELDSKTDSSIFLLHGDVAKKSNYLPLDIDNLNALNFDYIALGHIHKAKIFSNKIAYCGSPEPLDFGELGNHGIIEGSIEDGETSIQFIPFSLRSFHELRLDIDGHMSHQDIINKIRNIDHGNKSRDFYRIDLNGLMQQDIDLRSIFREAKSHFYHIELIDNTRPDYDLEELEEMNKDNIIGLYIKTMKERDLEDKVYNDALLLGLEALMKGRA